MPRDFHELRKKMSPTAQEKACAFAEQYTEKTHLERSRHAVQAAEHEAATIRAFVVRDKQERLLSFAASPKKRKKFISELPHFRWFDKRYSTPVTWSVDPKLKLHDRHIQGIENIIRLLKSKGAGETCYVISENVDIDGKHLALGSALESVVGSGTGTILSCIPDKLAYFEGEDECLLLTRS